MRNLRWQILIAAGGLLLVVALLIGQGSLPEVDTALPVAGGSYTEGLVGSLNRMNPILDSNNQVDRDINRLIYSSLVRFDSRGNPIPDLAQVAVSADATIYTFTIRDDALWHDGQPVTSDDVIYTFSKFQDGSYPGAEDLHDFWQEVNIVPLDEKTVQFQLSEPFAPFLDYVSTGLLPDHLLRGVDIQALIDHPFNLNPIGSGPFKFDRYLLDEGNVKGVSLVANDEYYGKRPFLERLEFLFYKSTEEALDAYNSGEIQGIGSVSSDMLGEVLSSDSLDVYSERLPNTGIVFLNTAHPDADYLAEKSFRQALRAAINRQWIIDRVLDGQASVAVSPILPGTWAYANDLQPAEFSIAEAEALLNALEWEIPIGAAPGSAEYVRQKDGETLELELIYPDEPPFNQIAPMIEASWEAIGIDVSIEPIPADELTAGYLEPRNYQAALAEISFMRSPDPDPYPFWHASQAETGQNYSGFADRNISIWLERARTTPDFGRRAELYQKFQYRFYDQVPSLLLYHPIYTYVIDSEIQGVAVGPLSDPSDRFLNVNDWHLLARRALASEIEDNSATP